MEKFNNVKAVGGNEWQMDSELWFLFYIVEG